MDTPSVSFAESELAVLRLLSAQYKDVDAATSEIARLTAELTLPKGSIHVLSDVHGEDVKLRHIINNASGTLRPLVDRIFSERSRDEKDELLSLLFYPAETLESRLPGLSPEQRTDYVFRSLNDLLAILRILSGRTSLKRVEDVLPKEYASILREKEDRFYEITGAQRTAVAVAYFTLVIFLGHQTFLAFDRIEALAR